jgi:hypothetical protein
MKIMTLSLLVFPIVLAGAVSAYASGQEYDSKEARAEQEKRHKAEHRNGYHAEYMAHHSHRTVGRHGSYTHQHPYHDLEIPMLGRDGLLAKPKRSPDGTVSLNNKYCPVTGDMAKSEFGVESNGVIYNVACKWSIDSIKKNPDKYKIDLNHFEIS